MQSRVRPQVRLLNRPRRRNALGAVLPAALLVAGQLLSAQPALAMPVLPQPQAAAQGPISVVAREVETSVERQRIVEMPIAASHVAIHWHASPTATITVAFATVAGRFGPEITVELDEAGQASGDGETFASVIWAGGARYVRVTSDQPIDRLTVVAFDSTGAGATVFGSGTAIDAAMAQSPVITRAAWGANESLRFDAGGHEHWPPSFNPVQKFFVHHTDGRNGDPDPAATIRAIYDYHAVIRGWGDIGYNFVIDEAGRIYEGRHARTYAPGEVPTSEDLAGNVVRGGHAKRFNEGSVGIALLGTFTTQSPTAAARAALERLLAWEAERHGIGPQGSGLYTNPVTGLQQSLWNISGHRDVNLTSCPGDALYATLPALRIAVANRIAATSGPSLDQTAPVVSSFVPMATEPTGSHSIAFGLIFSEPVTDLSESDFTVSGSPGGWSVASLSGSGAVYTVTVSADQPADGSVIPTLAAGSLADLAGNPGPVDPAEATAEYALDETPPSVALFATPNVEITSAASFDVTATFSEPVTGLSPDDVVLGGSSNSATPWAVSAVSGSGAHYAFTITRSSPATGDLTIGMPTGVTTDVAANPNLDSNTLAINIDRTPPVTTAPITHLQSNVSMASSLPADVTWTSSDVGGAGIKSYDLARSIDGATFSVILTGLSSPSASVAFTPGHTYRFEARARDGVGNVGAWVAGPTLHPRLLQQSIGSIVYRGTWYATSSSVYSGGSATYATDAGASASLTVSTRSIAVVTSRGPSRGAMKIYVDGVLAATLDLRAASASYRSVAYARTWSSLGTHTIEIVVVETAGRPPVDLDAIEFIN